MQSAKTEEFLKSDMETTVYPSYLQLANVIVRWQSKVLLIHRNTEPFKDYWSTPGGRVEANESYENAALRELDEEVGILPDTLRPLYVFIDHEHELESHVYETTSKDNKVSNPEPDEQDSASWYMVKRALQLQLTPGVRQALISLL